MDSLRFDNGKVRLRLETDFPKTERAVLRVERGAGKVAVRRPFWCPEGVSEGRSHYAVTDVKAGDARTIDLACRFRTETPPDAPDRVAVFYGPILLAGRLGSEGVTEGDVRSLNYYTHDYRIPAALATVMLEAPSSWVRLPRPSGEPTFRTPSGRIVSPHWAIHAERYVVYWNRR